MIFPDELTVTARKPYKVEIVINSSADEEENHLRMLLLAEIPWNYPNNIPFLRLKNLTTNFLNNKNIDKFETEIRALARENLGTQMMFDICEHLR